MDDKLLLTVLDVAHRTSWSRSFVYRLIQTEQLRSISLGRSRRVLVADLEAFVRRLGEEAEQSDEAAG